MKHPATDGSKDELDDSILFDPSKQPKPSVMDSEAWEKWEHRILIACALAFWALLPLSIISAIIHFLGA